MPGWCTVEAGGCEGGGGVGDDEGGGGVGGDEGGGGVGGDEGGGGEGGGASAAAEIIEQPHCSLFHSVPAVPCHAALLQLSVPTVPPLSLAHWVQHVAWLLFEFPIHPKVGLSGHAVPCASRRP